MSLKALQGFVRIVELDSFSEAADALFLSQSALSQQIRALEAQLKVQLFRHARPRGGADSGRMNFIQRQSSCWNYTMMQ